MGKNAEVITAAQRTRAIAVKYDRQYKDEILTEVEKVKGGYVVTGELGSLFIPDSDVEPKVGDIGRYFGEGMGRPVRGFAVIKVAYFRTADDQKKKEEDESAKWEAAKKKEYARSLKKHDARIALLPAVFQQRIREFRAFNPDFGWKYESYELFCCEQAVVFAQTLKTKEALASFHAGPTKKLVPGWSDQHSGNTFGTACLLARLYMEEPELVPRAHGAMCPVSGCSDYGCYAARKVA